jgi:hypothetical protein
VTTLGKAVSTSSPAPAGGPGGLLEGRSTVDKAGDVVAGAGERLGELPAELVVGFVVGMAGAQASPLASNTRPGVDLDGAADRLIEGANQANPIYAVAIQTIQGAEAAEKGDYGRVGRAVVDVGVTIVMTAVTLKAGGGKGGGATGNGPKSAYSVAFEVRLRPEQFGMDRPHHFNTANQALRTEMATNSALRELVGSHPKWGKSPEGWTWHHAPEPGLMQLVPRIQHTKGSPFYQLLHDNGNGGYHIWAIPAGATPNK